MVVLPTCVTVIAITYLFQHMKLATVAVAPSKSDRLTVYFTLQTQALPHGYVDIIIDMAKLAMACA